MLIPNIGNARTLEGSYLKGETAQLEGETAARRWFNEEAAPDAIELVVMNNREADASFSHMIQNEFAGLD